MLRAKKTVLIWSAIVSLAIATTAFLNFDNQPPGAAKEKLLSGETNDFGFIRSFADTNIDGNAKVDAENTLEVSLELRRMFDYFLAATGERPLPDIVNDIESELKKKLQGNALQQAKALLGRYLAYKKKLFTFEAESKKSSGNFYLDAKSRFENNRTLRREFFVPNEDLAFFKQDDEYDLDALQRLELHQNSSLTAAQKSVKEKALDEALSPELKDAKIAPYQVVRLEEAVTQLRKNGATDDDVYRFRAASTSPEAAARLAQVDREDAEWRGRITAYLQERNQLARSAANNPDQEHQLQQVRDRYFTEAEQKRLAAYE
jgi:lipase chaperone LimK